MKHWIFIFLICAPICCFSQTDQRIDLYNEYFQKQDFANALSMAESLIASFPDSMEYHREKAKMLAATDQKDAFFQEMKFIRNASNKDNISTFVSALSHDLVKREFRDELRRFYHAAKDTQVLLNWPSFDYEKTIDCKELIQPTSQNQPDLDYSAPSDQPDYKEPAPGDIFRNLPEPFLRSIVVTPYYMNSFPFGEISVRNFLILAMKKELDNGKHPQFISWDIEDNEYYLTLKLKKDNQLLQILFTHLLSKTDGGGKYSSMNGYGRSSALSGFDLMRMFQ